MGWVEERAEPWRSAGPRLGASTGLIHHVGWCRSVSSVKLAAFREPRPTKLGRPPRPFTSHFSPFTAAGCTVQSGSPPVEPCPTRGPSCPLNSGSWFLCSLPTQDFVLLFLPIDHLRHCMQMPLGNARVGSERGHCRLRQ